MFMVVDVFKEEENFRIDFMCLIWISKLVFESVS